MLAATETRSPESDDPRPLKLRILRVVPVVLILGLLVHLLLPRLDTITDSLETLRSMKPWAIAMAVFMESLSYVANGALLQSIVGLAGDRISLRRAAAIEIGAGAVALVAVGALGFGAAVYKWTRDGGVSEDTAMLASWLPSMFDAVSMILFALLSGVELLFFHRLSGVTVTALVIVVSALTFVIGGAIVLLGHSNWMMATVTRISGLMKKVRRGWDDSGLIHAAQGATETWQRMGRGELAAAGVLFADVSHVRPSLPQVRIPGRRTASPPFASPGWLRRTAPARTGQLRARGRGRCRSRDDGTLRRPGRASERRRDRRPHVPTALFLVARFDRDSDRGHASFAPATVTASVAWRRAAAIQSKKRPASMAGLLS